MALLPVASRDRAPLPCQKLEPRSYPPDALARGLCAPGRGGGACLLGVSYGDPDKTLWGREQGVSVTQYEGSRTKAGDRGKGGD